VLEALRRNERLAGVPVVVLTSSASPAERLRIERLGVERFITKPPDLEEFLQIGSVVADLLRNARSREAS
jgi:CheY-like chemotaxis protein